MGGILNLLVLLLMITNVKHVLISFQNNGFTLSKVYKQFVESKVYGDISNYQTIAGLLLMPIFTANSYWIEVF
jgi:hypothetical protein